ncbi:hypothetical protein NST55_28645 [Bacillus sp. FSL R10-2789]
MKIQAKSYKRKMSSEELQEFMKAKRQGNGAHKSKKAYDRKRSLKGDF